MEKAGFLQAKNVANDLIDPLLIHFAKNAPVKKTRDGYKGMNNKDL